MTQNGMSPLVSTDWLEKNLGEQDLRVYECTVDLNMSRIDGPPVLSGRAEWAKSHIPGSGFLDLLEELSSKTNPLPFMMPTAEQFAGILGEAGVGPDHRVVLYDRDANMWAARLWWMLRYFGFDNASVLSGGWSKWLTEDRPVSDTSPNYPPADFEPNIRPGLIADKAEVLAALDDDSVLLVNALAKSEHAGETARYSGRAGHIPGSENVPARSLLDGDMATYRSVEDLQKQFDAIGSLDGRRIIAYCGGGIAACSDALVLSVLGADDVAVYDGSMLEWAADPSCPLETGAES